MKFNKINLTAAFKNSLPILFAYIFLGMAFGLLLHQAGFNWPWALLTSVLVYAGSLQFVLVSLLAGGAPLVQVAVMSFLINSRHMFYGLSFIEKFNGMGKVKPYMIHSLTDETYSVLTGVKIGDEEDEGSVFFLTSLFNHSYWVMGSVLGALVGSSLPVELPGIEFSMTALFTVIFTEQWLTMKNHLPALTGLVSSIVCLLLLGPDHFILPSLAATVAILMLLKTKLGGEDLGSN